MKKKDKYAINSVNSLVHEVDGFIEKKERNKYLNFAFTDGNSKVLKIYAVELLEWNSRPN